MKTSLILLNFLLISASLMAQKTDTVSKSSSTDSLLNSINSDNKKEPVLATFESTRLVLSQSTQTVKKKNFNFQIIHRFGDIASKIGGGQTLFGLDAVSDVNFRFEYGLSDDFNIIFERSTIGGLVALELKYAMLHQTADDGTPVSITVLGETGVRPYGSFSSFSDRQSSCVEAIFACKFSSQFSLQVSPSYLTENTALPLLPGVEKQFFSLSAAARLKVTKHMGIIVDYAHPFSSFRTTANGFYDPLGFGLEMITGGHVFTINITNSRAVSEMNYLSNTQSDYGKGQYRIGFTISRMFDFNHKESYKTYKPE
jgi:hypothetical protein